MGQTRPHSRPRTMSRWAPSREGDPPAQDQAGLPEVGILNWDLRTRAPGTYEQAPETHGPWAAVRAVCVP